MKSDIKARWIAALRSGDYNQCRGKLVDEDGYCCLGVLAAIQKAEVWQMSADSIELVLDDQDYFDHIAGYISAGLSKNQRATLAAMNDGRGCEPRSFDHIAGYIQAAIEDTP